MARGACVCQARGCKASRAGENDRTSTSEANTLQERAKGLEEKLHAEQNAARSGRGELAKLRRDLRCPENRIKTLQKRIEELRKEKLKAKQKYESATWRVMALSRVISLQKQQQSSSPDAMKTEQADSEQKYATAPAEEQANVSLLEKKCSAWRSRKRDK